MQEGRGEVSCQYEKFWLEIRSASLDQSPLAPAPALQQVRPRQSRTTTGGPRNLKSSTSARCARSTVLQGIQCATCCSSILLCLNRYPVATIVSTVPKYRHLSGQSSKSALTRHLHYHSHVGLISEEFNLHTRHSVALSRPKTDGLPGHLSTYLVQERSQISMRCAPPCHISTIYPACQISKPNCQQQPWYWKQGAWPSSDPHLIHRPINTTLHSTYRDYSLPSVQFGWTPP